MTRAQIRLGDIVWVHEIDLETRRTRVRRLRRVMTNAVDIHGRVLDEAALLDVIDEAVSLCRGEDIDGFDLKPHVVAKS